MSRLILPPGVRPEPEAPRYYFSPMKIINNIPEPALRKFARDMYVAFGERSGPNADIAVVQLLAEAEVSYKKLEAKEDLKLKRAAKEGKE